MTNSIQIGGHRLYVSHFKGHPSSEKSQPTILFFHGQGDHSGRYRSVFESLLEKGYDFIGADLPGHGNSTGKRGVVPGWDMIDEMIQALHIRIKESGTNHIQGLFGHSLGGLIAIREALYPVVPYSFLWLSSPLIIPENRASFIKRGLLLSLSRLFPNHCIPTSVNANDCRHPSPTHPSCSANPIGRNDPLLHDQINLRWGRQVLEEAKRLRSEIPDLGQRLPLLITQGTDDLVCPVEYARRFFQKKKNTHYAEFAGMLHEPFSEPDAEVVLRTAFDWLDSIKQDTSRDT